MSAFVYYGSPGADVIQIPPGRIPHKGSRAVTLAASATSAPVEPRNAPVWHQVAEFLDAQWLASFGVRKTATAGRKGPACGKGLAEGRDVLRLPA